MTLSTSSPDTHVSGNTFKDLSLSSGRCRRILAGGCDQNDVVPSRPRITVDSQNGIQRVFQSGTCKVDGNVAAKRSVLFAGTPKARRGGYLYVGVMLVATLVGLMGLTAIRVGRLHLRSAIDAGAFGHAVSLSESAIEHAVATIQNDPAWRATLSNNVEYPAAPISMGTGSWTWKLVDEDGSLSDDDSDFVGVVGIGRDGGATVAQSVRVYPSGSPVDVLDYALHSGGNLTLSGGATVTTDHVVSSNDRVVGPESALIFGVAVGTSGVPCPVSGTWSNEAPRSMPGSSVFEYYEARGGSIPIEGLPLSGSVRMLESSVLSPASNPYSASHAAGIYVIDCQNQTIVIRNCRIVGTLLLLNPGVSSRMTGSVVWDQSTAGFPTLLSDGSFLLDFTSTTLSESGQGVNFNPAGTPYLSESDSDSVDSYPTAINGGIYVAGDLMISSTVDVPVTGTVISSGTITAQNDATFLFDTTSLSNPPPGFASGNPMLIVPGSHRREALP